MDFEEGLAFALQGRAILFTGAGFSYGALDLQGKSFHLGSGLGNALATEIGFPVGIGLEDVGDAFAEEKGAGQLLEHLKTWYTAKSVTSSHRTIARIPWRKVYTTNYDDVFETACVLEGKRVDSIIPLDPVTDPDGKRLQIVHLNGFIKRATEGSVSAELKLTGRSYATGAAMDDDWTTRLRFDLHAAQAIFFVGYSLPDLDLKRVLLESELAAKSFFVLGKAPDAATTFRASSFGLLVAAGVDDFADQVEKFGKSYEIPAFLEPIEHCVRRYAPSAAAPGSLEDRYVFDLMMFGKLREQYLVSTLLGESQYCLPRQAVVRASNAIEARRSTVFLHSAFGNGKTIAMEELKYMLFAKGFAVYSLKDRGETLAEELHNVFSSGARKAIFIDSYIEWLDVIPLFRPYIGNDTTLILSARSSSHDALQLRILRDLGEPGDDVHFNLDLLEDADLTWVSQFFDAYGFWGDEAFASDAAKLSYLRNKCEGEWRGLLLKIFDSPQMIDRLNKLFAGFRHDSAFKDPLIRLSILSVLAYQPNSAVLASLCGDEILLGGFRRDAVVSELLEFTTDGMQMRSSVMAEAILKNVADPNLAVRSLIVLIRRADRLANSSTYFFELFKNLVRFSSFHLFFPEKELGKAAMRVYESVKSLEHCARSPLFWLQYAIAALVSSDFSRSGTYFDTAYSFAKGIDRYDSFQIDNHFARFLLERAIARGDADGAMESFRRAKGLLAPQFREEWRHYPYRVAIAYYDFFSVFSNVLQSNELDELRRAAEELIRMIEALPQDRFQHRSVQDCYKAQQKIIAQLS